MPFPHQHLFQDTDPGPQPGPGPLTSPPCHLPDSGEGFLQFPYDLRYVNAGVQIEDGCRRTLHRPPRK
jgi:hypothetical protein